MWDLIVSVPDNCLSFYFTYPKARRPTLKKKQQQTINVLRFRCMNRCFLMCINT